MFGRKVISGLGVVGLLAAVLVGQGFSQDAQPRERPRRGQWDANQVHQRMLEGIKKTLGADDETWAALQPKVEKVQTLTFQTRGLMGRGMRAGRTGRQPQPAPAAELPQPTELEKAAQDLRQILEKPDAPVADITAKLVALRSATEKVEAELAAARKELREMVSVRQEAQLVLMGLLD